MSDYTELVKALRCKRDDCEGCDLAFFDKDEGWMCQFAAKDDDAAAAIEELQAAWIKSETDATNLTGRLAQAEADLLKEPKRGEWVEREVIQDRRDARIPEWQQARCSVCGKWHTTPYMYCFDDFDYCPNCGARMDGGKDDKA